MEAACDNITADGIERGKPIPDTIHAIVPGNRRFGLRSHYGTTPDLALYPTFVSDYDHRQACWVVPPAMRCVFVYEPPGRFRVFYDDDALRDEKLGIELPLAAVFS